MYNDTHLIKKKNMFCLPKIHIFIIIYIENEKEEEFFF